MSPRRPLRILFLFERRGFVRQYASVVRELVARGHEVQLAFSPGHAEGAAELVEQAVGPSSASALGCGASPTRGRLDGWRPVAWLVRALADLARYAHPRYDGAPALRRRMQEKVLHPLREWSDFDPVGRRVALRLARRLGSVSDPELSARAIRLAARLESAIPTSRVIDRYLRGRAPDVVLATPLVKYGSDQVDLLKSARRLRIPAGICVASWDNLTNKGLLKFSPERVFVWNEVQRREAVELHGIPPDRVVATGAQLFDEWFERRPSRPAAEFAGRVGLDPGVPFVLYLASSPFVARRAEVEFVLRWLEALRASGDEHLGRLGVLVRPHPNGAAQWSGVDLGRFGNAAVWSAAKRPIGERARADFFDSIAASAAVVGINTTAMIEAAVVGRSVLTVLVPELAQEGTLHFHYLLHENGGFLHVADSLEEHLAQLARVLEEDDAAAEARLRFVEAFVRPRGLDRPATPILADEIEKLATLPVRATRTPVLLRSALAVEAGLTSATIASVRLSRRLRRLGRRARGKVRRHRPAARALGRGGRAGASR